MAKVALLIGVSDYLPSLSPLPNALHDIQALQTVLNDEKVAAFDEVQVLPNSERQDMEVAIYNLFANRRKDDVVLLYFSGHGVRDVQSLELFFATPQTQFTEHKTVVTPTAVAASFLQGQLERCKSDRTVVILDCCYSGAFPKNLTVKGVDRVDVEVQLGGKGCAILTSSTATQSSRAAREASTADEQPLSLYTHYLVEGLRTGAADLDGDGHITAYELHQYTHQKVTEESPAMTPEFYPVREGHEIYLAKMRMGDPLLLYRKEVRRLLNDEGAIDFLTGEFDEFERIFLDEFCLRWNIAQDVAAQIEKEVTEPLRQLHQKLRKYEDLYQKALKRGFPFSERIQQRLQDCQKLWGLRDENIAPIEGRLEPKEAVQIQSKSSASTPEERPDFATSPTSKPTDRPSFDTPNTLSPKPETLTEKLDQIELNSAKGADYRQLRDLLKQQDWRLADEETRRLMLEVGAPEEKDFFLAGETEKFPCEDLHTIDELWDVASNGHFGFSVQKRIWERVGGKLDEETETKLGNILGWRVKGSWLNYSDLDFSLNALEGHLPSFGVIVGEVYWWMGMDIFARIDKCNISLQLSDSKSPIDSLAGKLTQVELQSAKGADYQKLRDLLKQQAWREADQETRRLMLEVGDPDDKNYLNWEDIKKFPCEDLRTINELWTVASNGHFSFSVQKQIWQRVGGKVDVETERKLGDAVGWRVDGKWLNYNGLTFDSNAPEGHLPVGIGRMFEWSEMGVSSLASRLVNCNL